MDPSERTTYLQGFSRHRAKGRTKASPALGIEVSPFYEAERFEHPTSGGRSLGLLACAESPTSHMRFADIQVLEFRSRTP